MNDIDDYQTALIGKQNCSYFFTKLWSRYSYLFQHFSAQLVHCEDYRMFGGCSIVVEVGGMKIWFELDRGGESMRVGPSTADISGNTNEWQPLTVVLDFLADQYPTYRGPGHVDARIVTPQAERAALEKLVIFYSQEYPSRRQEFLRWYDSARQRFLDQVNEFYESTRNQ